MKNILVPTDFSEISDYGLHVAVQIARRLNARVHLLNLITPPTGNTFAVTGDVTKTYASEEDRFVAQLLRINKERLTSIASTHAKDGISINILLKVDDWQEGIKEVIEGQKIDFIVMGTSGESSLSEFFVGNHTEQVIRISHKPVLTVRDYFTHFDVKNLVFATDLDIQANQAIAQIKQFAEVFNAKIHLLHVYNPDSKQSTEVEAGLKNFAEKHQLSNYTINPIKHSDKAEGIRKFSRSQKADVIALITHGRSGLSNILRGSISEDVIKEATVPVLTVNMD